MYSVHGTLPIMAAHTLCIMIYRSIRFGEVWVNSELAIPGNSAFISSRSTLKNGRKLKRNVFQSPTCLLLQVWSLIVSLTEFILPNFAIGTGGLSGNPQNTALPTDLETQVAVIKESLRQFKAWGMRPWIDTALHYGAGNALKAIGLALDKHPDKDIILSIKVGRILEEPTPDNPYQPGPFRGEACLNRRFDYSEAGVLRAFEQSFEFLNKERLQQGGPLIEPDDLEVVVFVHDPERGTHGKGTGQTIHQVRNQALPALNQLKTSRKIKAIGIGTNEVACALQFVDYPHLDSVMVAGRLTLLSNDAPQAPEQIRQDTTGLLELLQKVKRYDKFLISAAPGQSGMLYKGGNWYNYQPASEEVISFRDKINAVFDKYSVPLSAGALQFPLLAGARAVVCGICSNSELAGNLTDFSCRIPTALWLDLESQNLINPSLNVSHKS